MVYYGYGALTIETSRYVSGNLETHPAAHVLFTPLCGALLVLTVASLTPSHSPCAADHVCAHSCTCCLLCPPALYLCVQSLTPHTSPLTLLCSPCLCSQSRSQSVFHLAPKLPSPSSLPGPEVPGVVAVGGPPVAVILSQILKPQG